MPEQIEISALDLRYEACRLKAPGAEKMLLVSILENGIRDPLHGVDVGGQPILLDGFKRYRCAVKLGIGVVPYASLGDDEVFGLISILRASNAKTLSILEQARLIDTLKTTHQMTMSDIAGLLEKSKAWVSVRSGIIEEMSASVADHIFAGRFPVYSFMYTLRAFMRLNSVRKNDIDAFVELVASKNLSTRDIDLLAHGYFKGPDDFRQQIRAGNIAWGIDRLKKTIPVDNQCTKIEQETLKMLEITLRYIQKLTIRCPDHRFTTKTFFAQANLLSGGIIRQIDSFAKEIRGFYDHTRQAQGSLSASPGGDGASTDRPSPQHQHQHHKEDHLARGANACDHKKGQNRDRSGAAGPPI